jgi:hypothetical protein
MSAVAILRVVVSVGLREREQSYGSLLYSGPFHAQGQTRAGGEIPQRPQPQAGC